MTYHWTREASLSRQPAATPQSETWQLTEQGQAVWRGPVTVFCGKPLDIKALKGTDLKEWQAYAEFLRSTASRLYEPEKLKDVTNCPCCEASVADAPALMHVWKIAYAQCPACQHVFVARQPLPEHISQIFVDSDAHAEVYTDTDPARLEVRLQQIVKPKLDWVLNQFQLCYQREPLSLLDVGAGGGHFVEVARRAGLEARGVEISQASCAFARKAFGLELEQGDFLQLPAEAPLDVITFWGLLEYLQSPLDFLHAARERLSASGLLIVEVPRADALSTAIQQLDDRYIARHMDPTSHVNCFSDSSLLTALWKAGFEPVAAWYFGMDIYELLIQLELINGRTELSEASLNLIPGLQAYLDRALLGDDIIMAAVPRKLS